MLDTSLLDVWPLIVSGGFVVGFLVGMTGVGAGSLLLPTGERLPLGEAVVTFGRKPESTIQLADPNASRNHAEIRPHGNGWVLTFSTCQ